MIRFKAMLLVVSALCVSNMVYAANITVSPKSKTILQDAAPRVQQPTAAAASQQPQGDTLQQQFTVTPQNRANISFGVTMPGMVYVDVSWSGVPLDISLKNDVSGKVVSSLPGNKPGQARLVYAINQADVQSGLFWTATISGNGNAAGTVRVISPKADLARLEAARKTAISAQKYQPPKAAAAPLSNVQSFAQAARLRAPVELPQRSTKQLTTAQLNLDTAFIRDLHPKVTHKPFTLEEVFDIKTGRPFYASFMDENTGRLKSAKKKPVKWSQPVSIQTLQRLSLPGIAVKHGTPVRLGKIDQGPLTAKSKLVFPRGDGSVIEVGADSYMRELNELEASLNNEGKSLREANGRLPSAPRVVSMGKLPAGQIKKQGFSSTGVNKTGTLRPMASQKPSATARMPSGPPKVLTMYSPYKEWKSAAPAAEDALCTITSAPEGELRGKDVLIGVKNAADTCVVEFYDKRNIPLPAAYSRDGDNLKVKVPTNMFEGMGALVVKSRLTQMASPKPDGTLAKSAHAYPFYAGEACSVDAVEPPIGATGVNIKLTGGRFEGCQFSFVDSGGRHVDADKATLPTGMVAFKGPDHVYVKIPSGLNPGISKVERSHGGSGALVTRLPALNTGKTLNTAQNVAHMGGNQQIKYSQQHIEHNNSVEIRSYPVGTPSEFFVQNITEFNEVSEPYSESFGDPSTFAVSLNLNSSLSSSGGEQENARLKFVGDASVTGTVFKSTAEIIGSHAEASIPSGTSKDGLLRSNIRITAAGVDVYNVSDERYTEISLKRDFPIAGVDYSQKVYFSLGPIPMSARFGFSGTAGMEVDFKVTPLSVSALASPYVRTTAYGECGIDLVIASAGVGAELTLLNLQLDNKATAGFNFATNKIDTDFSSTLTITTLAGSVYAYVETFWDTYEWEIFNWAGYSEPIYITKPAPKHYPLF